MNKFIFFFWMIILSKGFTSQAQKADLQLADQHFERADRICYECRIFDALTKNVVGETAINLNLRCEEAVKYYQKAKNLYKQENNWEGYIKCLHSLGNIGFVKAEQLSYHKEALDIAISKLDKFHLLLALSYLNFGKTIVGSGDPDPDKFKEAAEYFQKAQSIYKIKIEDKHPLMSEMYKWLGVISANKKNAEAKVYFEKSWSIWEQALEEKNPLLLNFNLDLNLDRWVSSNFRDKNGNFKVITQYEKVREIMLNELEQDNPKILFNLIMIGTRYTHFRKGKAKEYIELAIDQCKKIYGDEHLFVPLLYKKRAAIYAGKGFFEKAIKEYKHSLAMIQHLMKTRETLHFNWDALEDIIYGHQGIFHNMGMIYEKRHTLIEAEKCYKEVLNKKPNYWFLGQMEQFYRRIGKYEKSYYYAIQSLAAQAFLNNDNQAWYSSSYQKKNLRQALDKLEKTGGNKKMEAIIYYRLSQLYFYSGEFNQAINYGDTSLNLLEKDDPFYAINYTLKGNVFFIKGEFDKAKKFYEQSIEVSDKYAAANYINLGNIYYKKNKYDLAEEHYNNSLGLSDHSQIVAINYNNLGNIYRKKRLFDRALNFYKKALETINDGSITIDIYSNIGSIYFDLGDYSKAEEYFKIPFYNYMGSHPKIANCLINLSKIELQKQNHVKALAYCQKAIGKVAPDLKDSSTIEHYYYCSDCDELSLVEILQLKAKILKRTFYKTNPNNHANMEATIETYSMIYSLIDQLRISYSSEDSKLILARDMNKIYELAIETAFKFYRVSGNEKHKRQLFRFMEKTKSTLLLNAWQENDAKQFANIPNSLKRKEKELKSSIKVLKKRLSEIQYAKNAKAFGKELAEQRKHSIDSIVIILKQQLFDRMNELEALIKRLEEEYPEYHTLKYSTKVATIDEVQQQLDDSSALIAYFISNNIGYIFSITKNNSAIHAFIKKPDFNKKIATFLQQVGTTPNRNSAVKPYKTYSVDGYELYEDILSPALKNLERIQKLIIVPDGILNDFPFEALLTQRTDTFAIEVIDDVNYKDLPYLLRKYQINRSYSSTLLLKNMQQRGKIGEDFQIAVFAPFTPDSMITQVIGGLSELRDEHKKWLKFGHLEAKAIASVFTRGRFWFNYAANEKAFKNEADIFSIIHIITHGEANDRLIDYSKLLFNDSLDTKEDNILYECEVYNLTLKAELVVLSACESGQGKNIKGEGIFSVARSFMYAGCPSLVMTLWKVNDKTSASLMKYFYKGLSEGLYKDNALQKAKLDYLNGDHKLCTDYHPFYWAAYVCLGNDRPINLFK